MLSSPLAYLLIFIFLIVALMIFTTLRKILINVYDLFNVLLNSAEYHQAHCAVFNLWQYFRFFLDWKRDKKTLLSLESVFFTLLPTHPYFFKNLILNFSSQYNIRDKNRNNGNQESCVSILVPPFNMCINSTMYAYSVIILPSSNLP